MKPIYLTLLLLCSLTAYAIIAKTNPAQIKTEEVSYLHDGKYAKAYLAYDSTKAYRRSGIIILHEWWGCNDYAKKRARMLAQLGYVAIALDLYGDGKVAKDPQTAQSLATPFYADPQKAYNAIEAGLNAFKKISVVDTTALACVGYCFGGSMALNAAKMGLSVNAVVSFHGGLKGVSAVANKTKAKILVCHGKADQFVSAEEIKEFKQNLEEQNVSYRFIAYDNATHAFTNKDATATGKKFGLPIEYNAIADKQSWADMLVFLKEIFN